MRAFLNAEEIEGGARFILGACRAGRLLESMPRHAPRSLSDAYQMQERIFELQGGVAAGWFASATNRSMLRQLGLEEPYAARWRPGRFLSGHATVEAPGELGIALEAEVTFRLGRDLDPAEAPFETGAVLEAIAAIHPSFEIVISCFDDWMNQPPLNLIAEGGAEQWLVLGPSATDWRSLDLARLPVEVTVDGKALATGSTSQVLDGPLSVLVWLANHASARGFGLREGQLCNTGMCAPVHFARSGETAVADFGPLGQAKVTVA